MQNIQWHVGCSGFAYKEWKEAFYPGGLPQNKWFDFYTRHFNTLELNVSFYRFPTLNSLKGWYNKAPEGFSFSAKVPRSITHFKKMDGTERMLNDFYELLKEGLREKISCVLFQFPPQFIFSEERLGSILKQANPLFNNVIEFRHDSWWLPAVQRSLKNNNMSFCGVSYPNIRDDNAVINTSLAYYRFHGVPKLFYSAYDEAFLSKIVTQIKLNKKVRTAYIYFNNTASLAALHNAKFVQNLVKTH